MTNYSDHSLVVTDHFCVTRTTTSAVQTLDAAATTAPSSTAPARPAKSPPPLVFDQAGVTSSITSSSTNNDADIRTTF